MPAPLFPQGASSPPPACARDHDVAPTKAKPVPGALARRAFIASLGPIPIPWLRGARARRAIIFSSSLSVSIRLSSWMLSH